MNPANTAEPVDMPLELWTRMGSKNHVYMGVQIPMVRGNFEERKGRPVVKNMGTFCRELCKTAEPIEMPVWTWTGVGPRKHLLDGVHIGAT